MVKFNDLWVNHPSNLGDQFPCRSLGFPNFKNQCAIRMGVCLRRAGVTRAQMPGMITCGVHKADAMHFLRAQQVANKLVGAASAGRIPGLSPVYKVKDPTKFHKELYGRRGIMYIKDYWRRTGEITPSGDHIDVWNGYRPSTRWLIEWFSWLGYTGNYAIAREIWFWEVK